MSVSVKDISIGSFLSDLLFIGIDSEGESVGRGGGDNEMWLGLRRLISNKLYILQCIVIYSEECA